jgi:hypothetical protein
MSWIIKIVLFLVVFALIVTLSIYSWVTDLIVNIVADVKVESIAHFPPIIALMFFLFILAIVIAIWREMK